MLVRGKDFDLFAGMLRIIAAIADGTAPADLTVTNLAKTLPYSWAEQERAILRNT